MSELTDALIAVGIIAIFVFIYGIWMAIIKTLVKHFKKQHKLNETQKEK